MLDDSNPPNSEYIVPPRDPQTGHFLPGHSGVARVDGTKIGRPKGSRNKLGEQFVADLQKVWQTKGIACIEAAIESKPADVLKVLASILPRDVHVTHSDLADSELDSRITLLAQALGLSLESNKTVDVTPAPAKDPL